MRYILWAAVALATLIIATSCSESTAPEAQYDLAGSWALSSDGETVTATVSRLQGFWWYGGAFAVFGPEAFNGKKPQVNGSTWSIANDGWSVSGQMITRDSITGTLVAPDGSSAFFTGRRQALSP